MKHLNPLRYLWLAAVLVLAGCAGTKSLYDLAKTPEDYAKAVLSHHNALGEAALAMRADSAVSQATKTKLRTAYRKTVCDSGELAAGIETGLCAKGPAQRLQAASEGFARLRSPASEAELEDAAEALSSVLIDLISLVEGK